LDSATVALGQKVGLYGHANVCNAMHETLAASFTAIGDRLPKADKVD